MIHQKPIKRCLIHIEIYSTDVFLIVHSRSVNDKTDDNTFKAYVSKQSAVLCRYLLLFLVAAASPSLSLTLALKITNHNKLTISKICIFCRLALENYIGIPIILLSSIRSSISFLPVNLTRPCAMSGRDLVSLSPNQIGHFT